MTNSLVIEASAKINIGLTIGSRRPDGYHGLESIFQSVDLKDSILVERIPEKGIFVEGTFDRAMTSTTVYRAGCLFLEHIDGRGGFRIEVQKRIPAGAGLGGGSADAAGVLTALNLLYGEPFSTQELAALGSGIGSDVPFFLFGGAAHVQGRGEVVRPMKSRRDFSVLLVYPGFSISTSWAFACLDAHRKAFSLIPRDMDIQGTGKGDGYPEMYKTPISAWTYENDFTDALYAGFGSLREIGQMLKQTGAEFYSITGSGACSYGLYESMEKAVLAKATMEKLAADRLGPETMSGMRLYAIKPLETSLFLR